MTPTDKQETPEHFVTVIGSLADYSEDGSFTDKTYKEAVEYAKSWREEARQQAIPAQELERAELKAYERGLKAGIEDEREKHQTILDKMAKNMADSSHRLEYGCANEVKEAVKEQKAKDAKIARESKLKLLDDEGWNPACDHIIKAIEKP